MIDVIGNSNAPVCDYNLVSVSGGVVGSAKLTKLEAQLKNLAYGLNHVDKRYELVSCEETEIVPSDDLSNSPHLILPD
tara:strand:+ start:630 stop:863 length:234 start_codon:yes stop_codon:yes gene_type:complete